MYLLFFLFNIFFFIISLKILLLIFKDKYIFPFRVAEIYNFILNIITNLILISFFYNEYFLINVIIINCCLSYIFYNMLNMVNTSPRTKILLDIYHKKKINLKNYYSKYNEKIILENRIKRLKTNNEIFLKNNKIYINDKGIKFFKVIVVFFSLLKKI